MKPHIYFSKLNRCWICYIDYSDEPEIPEGFTGKTPVEAYINWRNHQ